MAGEPAQEWRLTVITEGYQFLQFKLPCGDGSLGPGAHAVGGGRCQRMLPSVVVRVDKLTDGEGASCFRRTAYELLDNNGKVIASIEGTTGEVAGLPAGRGGSRARARAPPRPRSFQNSQSVHR